MRRLPHPDQFAPSVRPRLLVAAAILALIGIPLAQVTTADVVPAAQTTVGAELSTSSYIETRDRLLGALPTDPVEATRLLTGHVLGPAEDVAQVATIELLRQAGIPVINLDGMIVAMPSGALIGNGPMLGEYLSGMTRSVRGGNFYTMSDVADILEDSEMATAPIPPDLLLAGIVGWGKFDGAPRESIVAGTAVRELGRLRGQPLFPGVDPLTTQVDLLQMTLLHLHLLGDSEEVDVAASVSRNGSMFGPAAARAADECRALYDALQLKAVSGSDPSSAISNTVFKDAFWATMEAANEAAAGAAQEALERVDYASKIANTIVFLTSLNLTLERSTSMTHFRHSPGDTSEDVNVVATAEWKQGETMQELECLQGIVGIDTQANGPMPGLRVKWRLEQDQTRARTGKLLRAKRGQGAEFTPTGMGGEITNQQGQSAVDLEPAVEKQPEVGEIVTGQVTVYASLDKEQVPDAIEGFLGGRTAAMDHLKGKATVWPKFLFDLAFDISLKAIMRAGMPVKKTTINVEYHGADMYLIQGTRHPFLVFYLTKFETMAYTCGGLNGNWKGQFRVHADETQMGQLLEMFGEQPLPDSADAENEINQDLDLRGGSAALTLRGAFNLLVEVDTLAISRGKHGVVGTAGLRVEESSMGLLLFLDPVADIEVVRLDNQEAKNLDEFCPDSGSYFP